MELRNVAFSVTNTLRGESLLKNIQPLVRREDGGYKAWLEEMQKYFQVLHVAEEDKCLAALLITRATVGQYIHSLMSNGNARIVELAKIRQGRTEGIQDSMQRVVRLAESACMEVDRRNEVVSKRAL